MLSRVATALPHMSILTRGRALGRRLRVERDGVSAVEFGIIAPLLVIMFGGVLELSGAITTANRSTFVTDAVAEMVSRTDHTLTQDELKAFALSSVLADTDIIRYARKANKDIEKAFKITITSVEFALKDSSCKKDCAYKANVVFSYTLNGTKRACAELTSAAATSQTMSTLPTGVFGPGSLVVVDVETSYSPIMPVRLAETISFKRSSYFRPRYVPRVNSDANCSGY